MCFVFQYSQKDLIAFQNYNFLNINKEKIGYLSSPIPVDKGCAKFRASLNSIDLALFDKRFEYLQYLKGATIFVNENDRIIMFEIYLFDWAELEILDIVKRLEASLLPRGLQEWTADYEDKGEGLTCSELIISV